MTAYLDIQNVSKTYESKGGSMAALDRIDLQIREAEFFSILGPSGCGKSTLLKCIAGLETVSGGSIRVKGQLQQGPPASMGIVFQRDALADWRTVLDNVLLVAEFHGLRCAAIEAEARRLLTMFGLERAIGRYPWELSGGMRQRVSICRALLHDPELLLMDEPFGALDAMTRDQLNLELQRIGFEHRKTIVFITHGISEAVFLSDRIVVMSAHPGRIVDIVDVELPRPRRLAVRQTPEFAQCVTRIENLFLSLGILNEH